MSLATPVDEALHPPQIALFGAITVVPAPQHIAHLAQQSGLASTGSVRRIRRGRLIFQIMAVLHLSDYSLAILQ